MEKDDKALNFDFPKMDFSDEALKKKEDEKGSTNEKDKLPSLQPKGVDKSNGIFYLDGNYVYYHNISYLVWSKDVQTNIIGNVEYDGLSCNNSEGCSIDPDGVFSGVGGVDATLLPNEVNFYALSHFGNRVLSHEAKEFYVSLLLLRQSPGQPFL